MRYSGFRIIKEELQHLADKYGDERRTRIVGETSDLSIEDLIADEDLAPAERNALRAAGYIESAGDDRWRYTHGVDLSTVRRLIDPDALAD